MSGGYRLDITARTLARFVQLEIDEEGFFSDNFFDLLPGEVKMVFFKTDKTINNFRDRLKVKSMYDVR